MVLLPGLVQFKERAYAGIAITVISASYSHSSSGDGLMALDPLVTLAALMLSYHVRPDSRRLTIVRAVPSNKESEVIHD